jgi:hypothetical protein|tara:strand:+ start:124 stop:1440 length:1317 start_codon:yes stop_codon:yes gene_type:complete
MDNFEEVLLNEDGDLIKLENFPQLDKEFEKVNESCNTQVNLNTDNIQFNSVISTGLQNLTKKSEDGTVVDTFFQKKFTDKDLDTVKRIISLEAYPELYGNELSEGMEFTGFQIVPMNKLMTSINKTYGSQIARQTDNVKYSDIKNNILTDGFKLRYNPIAVVLNGNGYRIVTGYTRTKILNNNCHMENAIVALYKVSDNKTFITNSLKFNMIDVPSGTATQADVIGAASELISEGALKKDYKVIREWLFTTCKTGPFTENTKEHMVQSIFNNASTRPQIYSWKPDTIMEWMENHGFTKLHHIYPNISYGAYTGTRTKNNAYVSTKKGEENIIYFVCAYSAYTKNMFTVASISNVRQFKNKNIRVIIHTSTLGDCSTVKGLREMYNTRLDQHNTGWKTTLFQMGSAFYNDADVKNCNIELYGALPAIRQEHNMDKLVLF